MKLYRISFSRTSRNAFEHFCSGLDEVTEKQIPKLKCQYDPETGMIFCWYCLSPIMPEQIGCECPHSGTIVTVFGDLENLTKRYTWGMLNPQKIKPEILLIISEPHVRFWNPCCATLMQDNNWANRVATNWKISLLHDVSAILTVISDIPMAVVDSFSPIIPDGAILPALPPTVNPTPAAHTHDNTRHSPH